MKLYVVRHQESEGNINNIIQGDNYNTPLTKNGIIGATQLAKNLERELGEQKPSKILSSPIKRAAQTAELIADRLKVPIQYDSLLIEMNPGVLIGPKYLSEHIHPEYLNIWNKRGDLDGIPGAEKGNNLQARAICFIEQYLHTDKSDKEDVNIIVSHAGFIRYLLNTIKGVSRTTNINMNYDNVHIIDTPANLNIKSLPLAKASEAYLVKTIDESYVLKKIHSVSEEAMEFQFEASRHVAQRKELLSEVLFWSKRNGKCIQLLNYFEGKHIYEQLTHIQQRNLLKSTYELNELLKTTPCIQAFKENNYMKDKIFDSVQSLKMSELKERGLKLLENPRYQKLFHNTAQVPVHYDLHPANVIFQNDDSVRFLDLGSIAYSPELFSPSSLFMSFFLLNNQNNFNFDELIKNWPVSINPYDTAILMQARAIIGCSFFEKKISDTHPSKEDVELYKSYIKSTELIEKIIKSISK